MPRPMPEVFHNAIPRTLRMEAVLLRHQLRQRADGPGRIVLTYAGDPVLVVERNAIGWWIATTEVDGGVVYPLLGRMTADAPTHKEAALTLLAALVEAGLRLD